MAQHLHGQTPHALILEGYWRDIGGILEGYWRDIGGVLEG